MSFFGARVISATPVAAHDTLIVSDGCRSDHGVLEALSGHIGILNRCPVDQLIVRQRDPDDLSDILGVFGVNRLYHGTLFGSTSWRSSCVTV
jgi:hypothetical protein